MGRPKQDVVRDQYLKIRVTKEEKELILKNLEDFNLSEVVRDFLLNESVIESFVEEDLKKVV